MAESYRTFFAWQNKLDVNLGQTRAYESTTFVGMFDS
jgi:hypothetical protein